MRFPRPSTILRGISDVSLLGSVAIPQLLPLAGATGIAGRIAAQRGYGKRRRKKKMTGGTRRVGRPRKRRK